MPIDVTSGGYAGKSITLHVPEDADFATCDGGSFASFGVGDDEPARYHQGPGQIDELWILDVGDSMLVIDAMYRPNTPTALLEEIRSIVASVTLE